jgi:hypothetical protein
MATVTPNFNWPVPTSTDLVKDGATAIEALGDSIDASLVDLKGGTTGQVLSKNSNTDMDFTWVTDAAGDITGVTAGTGISGGGTSGTVTVTNSMATAIDAKGDLVPGTGADTFARLAVGANGTVLTADSAETTGLKWATPSSGTPAFVGCSVYKSANQSIANATYTATTWNLENFDTNAFHDNSTNTSRITIPSSYDGKYLFTFTTSWASNVTGERSALVRKNGTTYYGYNTNDSSSGFSSNSMSIVLGLVATDYIEIMVYQSSTGNLDLSSADGGSNLQVTYLGA